MKKQLAVLMAAATAVTTVAPVVASADTFKHDNVSASEVSAKVKEALASRYTNKTEDGLPEAKLDEVAAYLNSTNAVFVDKKVIAEAHLDRYGLKKLSDTPYNGLKFTDVPNDVYVVTDAAKFATLAESQASTKANVYIVDKGVKDGKESFISTNKRYVADGDFKDDDTQVKLSDAFNALKAEFDKGDGPKYVDKLEPAGAVLGDATEVKVTLKSGTKLTLKIGGEALDFNSAKTSSGVEIDLKAANTQAVLDQIVSFGTLENAGKKTVTLDITNGDTNVYTLADLVKTTIEMPTIYTAESGYTNVGADFVNGLNKANVKGANNEYGKFNYKGVNYQLVKEIKYDDAKIDKSGDKYVLRFTVAVKDANDVVIEKDLQFAIEGKTQKDLARVLDDLKNKRTVVAGRFTRLIGADRFETAVEVSKESFKPQAAKSVVIVGANAVIDGLSAAPLASLKEAPVLLADSKTGLNNVTLNEISRACESLKNKTVYIVGGENSVPASVKKQLEDKFGAVVVRLSGADRFATSLDVARRIGYENDGNAMAEGVFLVGGDGAADAMSVSAIASNKKLLNGKVAPIVVVPKDGIPRNTREFLASKELKNAIVIGGESTLSSAVFSDARYLNKTKDTDRIRIAGADRFATNARIVEEFYSNKNVGNKIQVESAFFASGDSKYLVDAQTAGPLAARSNGPIILTGSKLTAEQLALFSKDKPLDGLKDNVYQVGGVVSADAMKAVVEKLGL